MPGSGEQDGPVDRLRAAADARRVTLQTGTSATLVDELAALLHRAEVRRSPVPPLTETWPDLDLDTAYAVQQRGIALRSDAATRLVGHKVGLTSAAMQQMLGVDTPDYGRLLDHMVVPDRHVLPHASFIAPKVEIETAFLLAEELRGPGVTVEDVLAATATVQASIEVIDSRIADWRIGLLDTVADNASSAAVVLGVRELPVAGLDLVALPGTLSVNGEVVEQGRGEAVLGHPAAAVAWLANTLGARGVVLEAGALVLPGACTRAVAVQAGDRVVGDFGPLGTVQVRFSGVPQETSR